MLTDEELMDIRNRAKLKDNRQIDPLPFARDVIAAVLAKAGEQEPVAYCRDGDLEREDFVAITEPHYLHPVKLYAHPLPAIPDIKND